MGVVTIKRIYLIRHAQTEWNAFGRFQGRTDTALSNTGIEQAGALAERLKFAKIDRIYSSPLQRAIKTAEAIAQAKGLSVFERTELIEADFGHWEGLTLKEIKERFPDEFSKCRSDPHKYGFRFGLEFDDMMRTVKRFADECIHKGDYENIAVVSHSVPLKLLVLLLVGLPPEFMHSFRIDNCAVSIIGPKHEEGDNKYVLLNLNDTGSIN